MPETIEALKFRKTPNAALDRMGIDEYKNSDKLPLVVLLDNVRSMLNVGSAFRTADAFLVEKIILTGITAKPPHREIHKSALGATESVKWEYIQDTVEAIHKLKSEGYIIASIEQAEPHQSLDNFKPERGKKYCLIFGNEVNGVEESAVQASDLCLEIPQGGTKHSLNISVSIGVVLWKFFEEFRLRSTQ